MNDLLLHTVRKILASPVVDHIEPPDLDLDPHQLVEMPTETIQIRTETSDEAIVVQLLATTASGHFPLV